MVSVYFIYVLTYLMCCSCSILCCCHPCTRPVVCGLLLWLLFLHCVLLFALLACFRSSYPVFSSV